jgi:putative transposase
MHGDTSIRAQCVSDGIPYCMDTKISPPHPESWRQGVCFETFPKVLEGMPGCEMVEQNVRKDHLHLVMVIPPRYAVSDVVGRIKGVTSKYLRKKFSWLKKVYWKENIVWSPGYFVSTVGVDEDQILKYVRWQGRQDEGQAKLDLF